MKKRVTPENPASVYLFYGDEFLVKERVRELIDEFLEPDLRNTNFIVVDGVNPDLSYLAGQLFTPSLFGGARVLLVENTTLFSARADHKKILVKVMDSWEGGDRKASFRALAQLISLLGIDSESLQRGADWMDEVLGGSATTRDREVLSQISREFLEENGKSETKGDEAALEEIILSSFPEQTLLIFTAASVDKRKKIFKALEKQGRVVECAVPREKRGATLEKGFFEDQVRKALQESKKTINQRAIQLMHSRSGGDLRQLHAEIDKLVAFAGDRKEITLQDVETLFDDSHEAEFFEFTNAMRTADLAKCLPALHQNLRIVSHPLQTLAIIANDIRRLMVARELLFSAFREAWKPGMSYDNFVPILRKALQENPRLKEKGTHNLLTMNEYALFNLLKVAQKFTMERLLGIMEAILDADVLLKSSRLGARSPQIILEKVVYQICKPERRIAG
jgi:DNA polymerase III subunit delta